MMRMIMSLLRAIEHCKHTELCEKASDITNARSVLSLGLKDIATLTPDIVNETCD